MLTFYRCCFSIIIISFLIYSYQIDWINTSTSKLPTFGMSVQYDSVNQRIYFAGIYDTVIQYRDTISTTFITAIDTSGRQIWRTSILPSITEPVSNGNSLSNPNYLLVDRNGSLYVIGSCCCKTIIIDSIVLPKRNGDSCNCYDVEGEVYIAKFNSSGHAVWAKRFKSQYSCYIEGAFIFKNDIYLSGSNSGYLQIDSYNYPNAGAFISKFSSEGSFEWLTTIDPSWSVGITLLPRSNDFLGIINSNIGISFRDSILIKNEEPGFALFTCKQDGTIRIDTVYHQTSMNFSSTEAYDGKGNYFLTGSFDSTLKIGSNILSPTKNQVNYWLAKMDTLGNFKWIRKQSFCSQSDIHMGVGYNSIQYTNSGHLLFSGSFSGILAFDRDTLKVKPSSISSNFDGFLFAFDENGKCINSEQLTGPGLDAINGLSQDNNSAIYIAGWHDSSSIFMQNILQSSAGTDYFICKLLNHDFSATKSDLKTIAKNAVTSSRITVALRNLRPLSQANIYNIQGKKISNNDQKVNSMQSSNILIIQQK